MHELLRVMEKPGIPGKLFRGDDHFLTALLVEWPDLVLNLVDSLRGKDALRTSVPGALEMLEVPYTGAGMVDMAIGKDRNLSKKILQANDIPTASYQLFQRRGTKVNEELGLPLIIKLNEGGGSVGIDNHAVKETIEDAQKQVDGIITTYRIPVIVENLLME